MYVLSSSITDVCNNSKAIDSIHHNGQCIWQSGGLVTFDANGGICEEKTRRIKRNSEIGELPIATYDKKIFIGWSTSNTEYNIIDNTYKVINNVTLYAMYYQNQLVGYWPFYEDFNDHSGCNNNPTINKDVQLVTFDSKKCIAVNVNNENNQYLLIPDSSTLRIKGQYLQNITVCAWQYLIKYYQGGCYDLYDYILVKEPDQSEPATPTREYCLAFLKTTSYTGGKWQAAFNDNVSGVAKNPAVANISKHPDTGKWQFVAITSQAINGKLTLNAYIGDESNNLELVGTQNNIEMPNYVEGYPIIIGKDPHHACEWLNSYVREVRIYQGSLSLEQLKNVMKLTNKKGDIS